MKTAFALLLLFPVCLCAQLNENFSDGNFTVSPVWTGSTADWVITSGQLQSNNTTPNSSFYLSTPNSLSTTVQWEFYLRLNFNPSSANYVEVYLTASLDDLTLTSNTGYFVRIGSSQDDICLYRKDFNGNTTKIIDGVDGETNTGDNTLKIKIIRTSNHQFTLYSDVTGSGNNYSPQGTCTDSTFASSAFFGILVKQSTNTFFQKHYFDDIVIQTYTPDLTPPAIQGINILSANSIDVVFSEPVEQTSSHTLSNYFVSNGIGIPLSAQREAANNSLVHLNFANSFPIGLSSVTINGVKDLSGNAISNATASFDFYIPQLYDIVIDEIMADPTPQVSLPNAEFIELKNTGTKNINLEGWRITTSASTSGNFPPYILPADSFLIISSTSNASLFKQYGNVLGIPGFPSLSNDGALIALVSKEGKTIHALEYSDEWYNNAVKKDGGWTLEMTDPKNPCTGATNWKASADMSGGTPGRKNAADGNNVDDTAPQLLRTYTIDSVTIAAVFDETLDSSAAAKAANYKLTNNTVLVATPKSPLFKQVVLQLSTALQKRKIETLSALHLSDCKGNAVGSFNKAKVALAEEAGTTDIVINEILFNPRPNAFDYVEIYNRSDKIVDASRLFIGNRTSGIISSLKKLSEAPHLFFPGEYMVISEDAVSLKTNYLVQNPQNVLTVSSLPSYPDDRGNVVLTNSTGEVVDELAYEDDWHFALISEDEGIALERLDPGAASQNSNNWHSAASTAGYGTPTYRNSQYKQVDAVGATITISPKIFSPDNDGNDDVATISHQFAEPGYVVNITIFDASGRLIRHLVKNDLAGLIGSWNWDGLGEKNQKLPIGTYIIYTEIFNLQGKKKLFKNIVVLARPL